MRPLSRLKELVLHAAGRAPETPWWDRDAPPPHAVDSGPVVRHVVDNRVFLFGLDQLYREAMKPHERGELLSCARHVAQWLGVGPADVPVEGYYTEHPELTEYFQLMRALQEIPLRRATEVERLTEFQRLLAVTSSPMFGPAVRRNLLPKGRDPLSQALWDLRDWNLPDLLARASQVALETDDYSLVGLAARVRDPVALAALRESVVLYAEEVTLGALPVRLEYVWSVDPGLAAAAKRFVDEFNRVMGYGLPQPTERRAWVFWCASEQADVAGRCVRLGQTDESPPGFYHWAVVADAEGRLGVQEFWADRVWTTGDWRSRNPGAEDRDWRAVPGLRRDDFR